MESIKTKLHQYIENMDEYQLRLLLSFIKNLFDLDD